MRKTWDEYFIGLAKEASSRSACLSRQIGACLVKDKSVISMGFNGPPRGVPHCGERYLDDPSIRDRMDELVDPFAEHEQICPRQAFGYMSGQALHLCIASHAEVNCINNAARQGICTKGATLYLSCDLMPCKNCLCEIINAGIVEVVVGKMIPYDSTSAWILKYCGVKIREYRGEEV